MQSRNTDELHDGFSSLLRVFDVGTSFYFLHAQKQLQPAPTLGTLTAAALLLFSKFLICKCFFLPLQQNHHCHKRRQEIRNRLGGNNTGKSGDLLCTDNDNGKNHALTSCRENQRACPISNRLENAGGGKHNTDKRHADELDTENLLCDCDYTGIF